MLLDLCSTSLFFFNDPATTEIYTLSLHDALPIWRRQEEMQRARAVVVAGYAIETPRLLLNSTSSRFPTGLANSSGRSEEHTSELQSQFHLVCRLLLEKKKKKNTKYNHVDRRGTEE